MAGVAAGGEFVSCTVNDWSDALQTVGNCALSFEAYGADSEGVEADAVESEGGVCPNDGYNE